jgi:hypothetical protein
MAHRNKSGAAAAMTSTRPMTRIEIRFCDLMARGHSRRLRRDVYLVMRTALRDQACSAMARIRQSAQSARLIRPP